MRHTNIRLFVQAPLYTDATLTLGKEQTHYLSSVMRCREGARFLAFNGHDGEWQMEITALHKKEGMATAITQTRQQKEEPDITLCFSPVKNAPLNTIIQKATELGVSTLQPVITERTNTSRIKTERLDKITTEAAEQCGRMTIPTIAPVQSLKSLLDHWSENTPLILCDESGQGTSAIKALTKLAPVTAFAILIGPEGGFSDSEFAILRQKPYVTAISMGPRILRADTAAIAALTCCQSVLGDWNEHPCFTYNEPA